MCAEKVSEFVKAVKLENYVTTTIFTYKNLDSSSLVLKVYSDAAFANNKYLYSQIVFFILLCYGSNRMHVKDYSRKNSKRVLRPIMGAEVYAFAYVFDKAFIILMDLEQMLNIKLPVHMFTDSQKLFESMTKGHQTTKKRLTIDIAAAQEAYKSFYISLVGLVSTSHNSSDGLSKVKDNSALRELIIHVHDQYPVQK